MKLVIITGAGLSAESGIATFRDSKTGLWANYDPMIVANYDVWRDNFDTVHEFYNLRRTELKNIKPNLGHYKIAEWEKKYPTENFTQNIDLLLEDAGCDNVVHVHGRLNSLTCVGCKHAWDIGYKEYDTTSGCPKCFNTEYVKPNVVMFNEIAPEYPRLYKTLDSMTKDDIFLCIGTSGTVIPVNKICQVSSGPTILNVLNRDTDNTGYPSPLNPHNWTHYLEGPITSKVDEIDNILKSYFGY